MPDRPSDTLTVCPSHAYGVLVKAVIEFVLALGAIQALVYWLLWG
jgi:hypothetical protein